MLESILFVPNILQACVHVLPAVGGNLGGCLSTAVVGIHGHLASIIARIANPVHEPFRFVCTLAH